MAARHRTVWLDPALAGYAAVHSTQPDELQRRLIAETVERVGGRATMQISPDQGVFMELITRVSGARSALEVGTFTGYSALCIARGLPADGTLLTCDLSEEWTAIARRYWAEAGLADKIELRLGPAAATLRSLPAEEQFDLAFIDADKPGYLTYYEETLSRLLPGGLIIVDNTLWSGRVVAPDPSETETMAIAAFNDALAQDDRVDVVLLTIGDGVTLARKR